MCTLWATGWQGVMTMFTLGVPLDVWVGVGEGWGGLMVNLVIALAAFEEHLSPNTTSCQKVAKVWLWLLVLVLGWLWYVSTLSSCGQVGAHLLFCFTISNTVWTNGNYSLWIELHKMAWYELMKSRVNHAWCFWSQWQAEQNLGPLEFADVRRWCWSSSSFSSRSTSPGCKNFTTLLRSTTR